MWLEKACKEFRIATYGVEFLGHCIMVFLNEGGSACRGCVNIFMNFV